MQIHIHVYTYVRIHITHMYIYIYVSRTYPWLLRFCAATTSQPEAPPPRAQGIRRGPFGSEGPSGPPWWPAGMRQTKALYRIDIDIDIDISIYRYMYKDSRDRIDIDIDIDIDISIYIDIDICIRIIGTTRGDCIGGLLQGPLLVLVLPMSLPVASREVSTKREAGGYEIFKASTTPAARRKMMQRWKARSSLPPKLLRIAYLGIGPAGASICKRRMIVRTAFLP